ncbi:MAG: C40 family peptidase [Methylococcales bacterium]
MDFKHRLISSEARNLFTTGAANRWEIIILLFLSACAVNTPITQDSNRGLPHSVEINLKATRPFQKTGNPFRNFVMREARAQLGKPYRFGGETPGDGFDCSGLVFFTHQRAGLKVPRMSLQQLSESKKVALQNIQPGDLVFFKLDSNVSHVGIYIGGEEFIHAPSHGKKVTKESFRNRYWVEHFVAAGHFYR